MMVKNHNTLGERIEWCDAFEREEMSSSSCTRIKHHKMFTIAGKPCNNKTLEYEEDRLSKTSWKLFRLVKSELNGMVNSDTGGLHVHTYTTTQGMVFPFYYIVESQKELSSFSFTHSVTTGIVNTISFWIWYD